MKLKYLPKTKKRKTKEKKPNKRHEDKERKKKIEIKEGGKRGRKDSSFLLRKKGERGRGGRGEKEKERV